MLDDVDDDPPGMWLLRVKMGNEFLLTCTSIVSGKKKKTAHDQAKEDLEKKLTAREREVACKIITFSKCI